MAIDPNIALGFRPIQLEQRNPLAEYAQIQNIQNNQLQNQLARQQMEQEQGAVNYLANANLGTAEGRAGLRQFGKTGLGYEKLISDQEMSALKRQELEGKVREQRMAALGTGLTSVLKDPSDANLTAAFDRLDATGVDTKPFRESLLKEPDVAKRQTTITQFVTSNPEGRLALTFVQPKPVQVKRADGSIIFLDENPNSSTFRQEIMPPQAAGMTPYEQGRLKYEGQRVGFEGQRVGLEGQRLAQDRQGVTYQPDANGNLMALPSKLGVGQTPTAMPVIGEGGVPVKGKQSAFAEKTAALQKQQGKDINLAITEIEGAIKPGGLLEQSTASGAGKLADTGAAFFGKATPGAIAAASLKPIADLGLKMIPRFEGPQSDKDTASYKEAAGQLANEGLPVATRKAAAQTMVRIMKTRRGQFANEAMAAEGIAPRIAPPAGFTPD